MGSVQHRFLCVVLQHLNFIPEYLLHAQIFLSFYERLANLSCVILVRYDFLNKLALIHDFSSFELLRVEIILFE